MDSLQGASAAMMVSLHDMARARIATCAHLGGWPVARASGVDPSISDAIIDAALAAVFGLLAEWAAEVDEPEPRD